VEQGCSMLQFAIFTDCRSLAETLNLGALNTQSLDGAGGEQLAKFFADFHQWRQIFNILPGERVCDNSGSHRASRGREYVSIRLSMRLFDECHNATYPRLHLKPSLPVI
jgi:hypothetical protein